MVKSTDIPPTNPELQEALRRGQPVLHRAELLAHLMEGYAPLLIGGTHGKTTTTALLSHVLLSSGLKPAFAVGGIVASLGTNGSHGTGPYFVAEADESDGSFLKYEGYGGIITNIDDDHLSHWKNVPALDQGFQAFAQSIRSHEHLFICGDDPGIERAQLPGITYGYCKENAIVIEEQAFYSHMSTFTLHLDGKRFSTLELPLIGSHNTLNATAVFALALKLGVPEEAIRQGFLSFKGIGRRQEFKGEGSQGHLIFDDYGHHPTEICATLRAFKKAFPQRRLVVAFQPHRYTRTRDCFEAFRQAFGDADALVLTDIYSAGETPLEGVTTHHLLAAIQQPETHYAARPTLPAFLSSFLRPQDLLVTMGAGDITHVGGEVLKLLLPT